MLSANVLNFVFFLQKELIVFKDIIWRQETSYPNFKSCNWYLMGFDVLYQKCIFFSFIMVSTFNVGFKWYCQLKYTNSFLVVINDDQIRFHICNCQTDRNCSSISCTKSLEVGVYRIPVTVQWLADISEDVVMSPSISTLCQGHRTSTETVEGGISIWT